MRKFFSWRLHPSKAEFEKLWENATFVFDTNFLLDLYRVSRSTAENFLETLESIQDRVWLPYQVVNEFLMRREEIIDSEAASFQKALLALRKWKSEQQGFDSLRGQLKQAGRIVATGIEDLFDAQKNYIEAIDEVERAFQDKIGQLANDHSSLDPSQDHILDRLLSIFDDSKVGEPFSEEALNALYEEGKGRYEGAVPPGYMDAKEKNDERKYGDLILWKEILNFARKESRPVIFVTGEKKEDWWIRRNGETTAPRMELRREFQEYVQQPFWMYRTQRFLEMAGEKLTVEIDPRSIEESKEIADLKFVDEQELEQESSKQSTKQKQASSSTIGQPYEQIKSGIFGSVRLDPTLQQAHNRINSGTFDSIGPNSTLQQALERMNPRTFDSIGLNSTLQQAYEQMNSRTFRAVNLDPAMQQPYQQIKPGFFGSTRLDSRLQEAYEQMNPKTSRSVSPDPTVLRAAQIWGRIPKP